MINVCIRGALLFYSGICWRRWREPPPFPPYLNKINVIARTKINSNLNVLEVELSRSEDEKKR